MWPPSRAYWQILDQAEKAWQGQTDEEKALQQWPKVSKITDELDNVSSNEYQSYQTFFRRHW